VASALAEESLIVNVTGKSSENGVDNCVTWENILENIIGKYFEK
jgi:hypothetical protein